jgi:hypothetical protein
MISAYWNSISGMLFLLKTEGIRHYILSSLLVTPAAFKPPAFLLFLFPFSASLLQFFFCCLL